MRIKLFKPSTYNWLLIAEDLDDPAVWDRFVPCHTAASQRWKFECVVKQYSASEGLKLKQCKELLTRGLSVYEYDWNAEDDQILSHAMAVAADMELDLLMEAPNPNPIKLSHNAA